MLRLCSASTPSYVQGSSRCRESWKCLQRSMSIIVTRSITFIGLLRTVVPKSSAGTTNGCVVHSQKLLLEEKKGGVLETRKG